MTTTFIYWTSFFVSVLFMFSIFRYNYLSGYNLNIRDIYLLSISLPVLFKVCPRFKPSTYGLHIHIN